MRAGSPPSLTIASRIAARSTTAGTPVKSCMSTRAGMNAISASRRRLRIPPGEGLDLGPADRDAVLAAQQFSSKTRSEYGRRASLKPCASSAGRLSISNVRPPASMVVRVPKLLPVLLPVAWLMACVSTSAARRGTTRRCPRLTAGRSDRTPRARWSAGHRSRGPAAAASSPTVSHMHLDRGPRRHRPLRLRRSAQHAHLDRGPRRHRCSGRPRSPPSSPPSLPPSPAGFASLCAYSSSLR